MIRLEQNIIWNILSVFLIVVILQIFFAIIINRNLKIFSELQSSINLKGMKISEIILCMNKIDGVEIVKNGAESRSNFNSVSGYVSLSSEVYNGKSVSATCTAAHETGHLLFSIRNREKELKLNRVESRFRHASSLSLLFLLVGFIFNSQYLLLGGMVFYILDFIISFSNYKLEKEVSIIAMDELLLHFENNEKDINHYKNFLALSALTYIVNIFPFRNLMINQNNKEVTI